MILGTHHHWHLLYSSWLWSPYWSSNGDFLLITIVFIFIVIIVLLIYWSWFLTFIIITFFFIFPGHDCFVGLSIVVFGIHCSHHFLFSFFFCCDCLVGFLVMVLDALWEMKWFAINLVIGFLNYNDHLQFFEFIVFTIFIFLCHDCFIGLLVMVLGAL
jgi:hypothetical protein